MPSPPATSPKYRPDIDGLRAVAVLAVLVFHAFPEHLPGGFLGVDVFFVLSGFLISSILFSQLDQGGLRFGEFYARRVRRIFPALLLVLIATGLLGWWLLLADQYKLLGKQIAGGAGFVANLVFWSESGYFEQASETKPLLHLWSLGIEEQFYLVWPPLLWLGKRLRLGTLLTTGALLLGSFALGVARAGTEDAFFLPHLRFWELLVGAALAALSPRAPSPRRAGTMAALGLAMILGALALVSRESRVPGAWALLPTLGTALVIAAGPDAWLNRSVLARPGMVFLGLISYPLYLWHWPLLSFARIFSAGEPPGTVRTALLALSVLLAWLTFKLVETPLRHARGKLVLVLLLGGVFAVGEFGFFSYLENGFERFAGHNRERLGFGKYFDRTRPAWAYIERQRLMDRYRYECEFYDKEKYRLDRETKIPRASIPAACFTRDPARSKALFIWGDSHAQQLQHGLRKYLPQDWDVLQVASSSCPADSSVPGPSTTDYCQQSNWFALKAIREARPDVVLVAQLEGHSAERFERIGADLRAAGAGRVLFVGPTPRWRPELHELIVRHFWFNTPRRTFTGLDRKMLDLNTRLLNTFRQAEGHQLFNLFGTLCDPQGCLVYLGDDRKTGITTWDSGHLTPLASELVAEHGLAAAVLGQPPHPPGAPSASGSAASPP